MNTAITAEQAFIFDTSQVPWSRRYTLKLLDALAWCGWALLWLPLVYSLNEVSLGNNAAAAGFFSALGFGVLLLGGLWLIFMVWARIQANGSLSIRRSLRRARKMLHIDQLAATFLLQKDVLSEWQGSQIMVAHHSEATGWLEHIDSLPHLDDRLYDGAEPCIIIKPH